MRTQFDRRFVLGGTITKVRAVLILLACLPALSSADSVEVAGLKGGVTHSFVRNQESAEICWAYALAGLSEGEYIKQHPMNWVILSPEYLGFYHIYFQLKLNLKYFYDLATTLENTPADEADKKKQEDIAKAYQFVKASGVKLVNKRFRDGDPQPDVQTTQPPVDANTFFDPDMGSTEANALDEIKTVGMIPALNFPLKVESQDLETKLEAAIPQFIGKYMLSTQSLNDFKGVADDGINDALFKALASMLETSLHLSPPRPHDVFYYNKTQYNALTFMKNFLKFNPDDFVALQVDQASQAKALDAVQAALKLNYQVPVGISLFNEQMNQAPISGRFTEEDCPNKNCTDPAGGHELLAVNWLQKDDKITGLIVKNSWGTTDANGAAFGLDANGNKTTDPKQAGYFVVTSDFLSQGFSQDASNGWDIVLPRTVQQDQKFADIKIELPSDTLGDGSLPASSKGDRH